MALCSSDGNVSASSAAGSVVVRGFFVRRLVVARTFFT